MKFKICPECNQVNLQEADVCANCGTKELENFASEHCDNKKTDEKDSRKRFYHAPH